MCCRYTANKAEHLLSVSVDVVLNKTYKLRKIHKAINFIIAIGLKHIHRVNQNLRIVCLIAQKRL